MRRSAPVTVIVALSVLPIIAHYMTEPNAVPMHDIYQRFCYLPVILTGFWFGARWGIVVACLIAIAYFHNTLRGWQGEFSPYYRVMDVAMYLIIGGLTGWLSDRLREATKSERQARKEVEKGYSNLRGKAEELFALEEQLRRADRLAALGSLTAGLAHEIRNPLASIRTSVEILRSREQGRSRDADEPDFTGIILEETARLDRILTDCLQLARAEHQCAVDEPRYTTIMASLRRVLDLTESERNKHNIRVMVDERELNVPVGLSDSLLRQVFLNLLINSVDAMPGGGEFRIRRMPDQGKYIILHAEDSGPGIPAAIATRIFDPFYSTKEQGTGLGLSIVDRILNAHNGSISLEPMNGKWSSRFIVKLPLAGEKIASFPSLG